MNGSGLFLGQGFTDGPEDPLVSHEHFPSVQDSDTLILPVCGPRHKHQHSRIA